MLIRIQKKMTPLWHSWYCLIYGLAQRCNLPEMSETGAKDVNTSAAVLYYSQNNSVHFFCFRISKMHEKMEIAGNVLASNFERGFYSKMGLKLKQNCMVTLYQRLSFFHKLTQNMIRYFCEIYLSDTYTYVVNMSTKSTV